MGHTSSGGPVQIVTANFEGPNWDNFRPGLCRRYKCTALAVGLARWSPWNNAAKWQNWPLRVSFTGMLSVTSKRAASRQRRDGCATSVTASLSPHRRV